MYGFWYSVRENYSFSTQELKELFFTSLAFAFTLAAFYEDLFVVSNDVRIVITSGFLAFFILALIIVFIAMYMHVGLQKIVGIRLGYKVTYSYWINGILIGLFLCILSFGKVPVLSVFILPGGIVLEHISRLRLGKFRYGMNVKDIARISLAGPIAHIILTTILGIIFFSLDKNQIVAHLITANLLLLIYSMLPIPKLTVPTKIDSASDGLGVFYFSRSIYAVCAIVILVYAVLIWTSTIFSFVLALLIGSFAALVYAIVVKPATG